MPLELVFYGHPALRTKGKRIEKFDSSLATFAGEMLDLMHAHDGCGLAAHQVGRPLEIAVIDPTVSRKERPSRAWRNGEDLPIESLSPLILINPTITPIGTKISYQSEGCLSIPGLIEKVSRPARVQISYQTLQGEYQEIQAEGLLARAAMHEVDHLHGILFIDHLSAPELQEYQELLTTLARENKLE